MATELNLTDLTCLTTTDNSLDPETTEVKRLHNTENGPSWSIPTLPHNKDFHLFVCYIQDNSSEVREIVADLEREGIKCCYHERDFLPGQQVIGNINDAINRSMCTLVVLSEQFVQSRFCLHEIEQALHARISQGYTIIPIKIEPCDVPEILKYITFIDAETIPPSEMYVKILDAFVWNGVSYKRKNVDFYMASGVHFQTGRENRMLSNGLMLEFRLSRYNTGCCRWLSMYRFKLEFDEEAKQRLQRYNVQITDEVLKELQTMISDSVHVKYKHIFNFFSLLTTLLFVMEILLFSGVLILILEYTLGSTMNEKNSTVAEEIFTYNIMFMVILWITFLCIHQSGVRGLFKGWKGITHGPEERSKNRLKRDMWKKVNKIYAESHKLIACFRNEVLYMMRYDYKPCQDLFIRRCQREENLKKHMRTDESLQAYTYRLLRGYIEDHVEMLLVPCTDYGRHKMANESKCLCLLVEEEILREPSLSFV